MARLRLLFKQTQTVNGPSTYPAFLNNLGPAFQTNEVFSYRIVKILIIKCGIYANTFAEKMLVAFAFKSHFFFSKNNCELDTALTRAVHVLTTNELVKLTML